MLHVLVGAPVFNQVTLLRCLISNDFMNIKILMPKQCNGTVHLFDKPLWDMFALQRAEHSLTTKVSIQNKICFEICWPTELGAVSLHR